MKPSYVRTGELREGRSLVLDEAVPLAEGHVRVTVEPIAPERSPATRVEALKRIRARQRARGHVPATKADVDRRVADERAEWD
jgi:hypothetical protein